MKNNNLYIDELKNNFIESNIISFEDIKSFYRNKDNNVNLSAIKARINRLIKQELISRVGRGKYVLGQKNIFTPQPEKKIKILAKKIKTEYPELKYCIWHTAWISPFMTHQPTTHYVIIEPESDSEERTMYSETVFRYLQDKYKNVFHKPDKETIQNYISENQESIIIQPLISEAPLQICDNISTATLEKILVDIFCDENLFAAQQGNEKATIFNEAFKQYTINTDKLLRYAARRTKRKEIENYLKILNIQF